MGTQKNQKHVPPTAGGLDCSGGIDTAVDGGELGFGITVTTAGGKGGTTRATFAGEVCVGLGFGFAVAVACTTGFGVAVTVTGALGAATKVGLGVVRTATGGGVVDGSWATVGDGVIGAAGTSGDVGEAVTDGTTGSALAVLSSPLKPCHDNANAVNATTTTAKATSASVDRRGA